MQIYSSIPKEALFVLTCVFIWNGFLAIPVLQELMISLEQGRAAIDRLLLSVLSNRHRGLPWEDTWLDFRLFICIRAGGHCNCICFISYTIYRKIIEQQERAEVRICENDSKSFRLAIGIRKTRKVCFKDLQKRLKQGCNSLRDCHSFSQYYSGDFYYKIDHQSYQ